MESDLTWREKQAEREILSTIGAVGRFVDAGIILKTVIADPNGDRLIDGSPPMRVINVHRFGGIIDTAHERPYLCGPSENPVIWLCSREAETIILHADSDPLGQLVQGSEGSSKTTTLVQWHALRWLEHLGEHRTGGQFAPTLKRLGLVQAEMAKHYRPEWGRYVVRRNFEGYVMCDGTSIAFQSTHKQSANQGSPVQGANLSWTAEDEKQDMVARHADIMSRGRSAKDGRCKRIATATSKDDSAYRDLRDALVSSGQWVKRTLSIFRSPFIDPAFLKSVEPTISAREFLRRFGDPRTGELPDLPPELAVYYGWLRSRNLVAMPQIAKDVTAAVIDCYPSYLYPGRQFGLICAHDPGSIYNTTTVLKMLMFGSTPTWVVVGELQTNQTTARQHGVELRKYLRDEFYVHHPTIGGPLPIVFCDPHGKGSAQTDYDSVYTAFQKEGFDVFNPAGIKARIPRAARIEMMNRLLGGSLDTVQPRLVIAADRHGMPVAPKLVEAFESLQKKPGDDDPEGSQAKNVADKTHAPAATAYGLWMFEQESLTEMTVRIARKAAGIS